MTRHKTDAMDTIPVRKGEELPIPLLERFLRGQIVEIPDEPLEVEQFPAGHSNLTYLLRAGEWEAVLRRPPFGKIAPKAHDMGRECRLLSELHAIFPLAPKPYLFSDNTDIIGAPFFVMERRRGVVLDTVFPQGIEPAPDLCRGISQAMVDTLVRLHEVDWASTGLREIARPDGFMERQVSGWIERYERAKTDDIEAVEELKKWMLANIPVSPTPTLIHYDYKLNNTMLASDDLTRVVAMFDWEMSTIGDPLADVGAAMSYWMQADDPDILKYGMGKPTVTVMPGFMTRDEFIQAYAEGSGRDVSQIHFYLTFAYFKLAVICQQIYYRYRAGQTQDERFAKMGQFVRGLVEHAREASQKRG
ncbi:phosphotransferase family protein [Brevibacillus dissolubilis]|uniref:phosphotransferase family protein n=1 Tax=Brevibacillus dissolubilis TaxID=1844116 RepID=UPI0021005702|nr:phosphotransferase family protein [Brevibacillus dissolubilis]